MSVPRLKEILEIEGLTMLEKHVLTLLAWHENEKTGQCCPSIETLARESGGSTRSVQRGLKELRAKGIIPDDHRGGRGRRTDYIISTRKGDKLTPFPKRVTKMHVKGDKLSPRKKGKKEERRGPAPTHSRRRPKVSPRDCNGRLMSGVLWSKKDVEARIQQYMAQETYMGLPVTREHAEWAIAACQEPGAF